MRWIFPCAFVTFFVVLAGGLYWHDHQRARATDAVMSVHPNRGDAMHCVIDRELRAMDSKSPFLPENGWHVAGGYGCHYQLTTDQPPAAR